MLLALLVGVLTLAGSGVGMFLLANRSGPETGPGRCSSNYFGCIPTLPFESVQAVLTENGFACNADQYGGESTSVLCELEAGYTEFRVTFDLYNDRIRSYYGYLVTQQDVPQPSESAQAFLIWLAGLPFGADPEALRVAQDWVAGHIGEEERAEVVIRGYSFSLEQSDVIVTLSVDGRGA